MVPSGTGPGDHVDPLSEKRQAKYVVDVPGTVADPHPKRSKVPSSAVRCGEELMKLRWAIATVAGAVAVPPAHAFPLMSQPSA